METGIGCRSELRHSCDPSIQSDPTCPVPDPIPGETLWSRWRAGVWANHPWLPLVPCPGHIYGSTEVLILAAPTAPGCPSYDSTYHTGPKYLSTSCLQGWAPCFPYPFLKPQLLTQCLAHHRPHEWSVFRRRDEVWTQELFSFGGPFNFSFPGNCT